MLVLATRSELRIPTFRSTSATVLRSCPRVWSSIQILNGRKIPFIGRSLGARQSFTSYTFAALPNCTQRCLKNSEERCRPRLQASCGSYQVLGRYFYRAAADLHIRERPPFARQETHQLLGLQHTGVFCPR